jgi:hypothetical protein
MTLNTAGEQVKKIHPEKFIKTKKALIAPFKSLVHV